MVSMPDGTVRYESRSRGDVPLEVLNVFEKDRFMQGEKVSYPYDTTCSTHCNALYTFLQ